MRGPALNTQQDHEDGQANQRHQIADASCRAHQDQALHACIIGQHQHHQPHRAVGKIDRLSDQGSGRLDKQGQSCRVGLAAENRGQKENGQKERDITHAIKGRRVTKLDQTWVNRIVLDEC